MAKTGHGSSKFFHCVKEEGWDGLQTRVPLDHAGSDSIAKEQGV